MAAGVNDTPWRLDTALVHGGTLRSQFGETSEAIFLTQGYVYPTAEAAEARFKGDDPGFVYSRYANPTVAMFEERLRIVEGAEGCRATASGMAAVATALMALVSAGDHIVAAKALFGSCRYIIEELLPRFGVAFTLVDGIELDAWRRAVRPTTRAFFLESPTNPMLEVLDIAGIAAIARDAGAKLVVDNVFATPLLQRPLALGADVVVYSATKHIDGQGRCLGGAMLGNAEFIDKAHTLLKHTGPSMSPFNAWVLLKGMETLPLRVERQSATAARLAERVAGHPAARRVVYPFRADHPQVDLARRQMSSGSTLIAIDVKGGKRGAFAVCNALRLVKISNNLGDAKSLITHPATTTHQRLTAEARAELGIGDGLLRLSVGLEDADDLAADLTAALDRAG
ncbi:MAG: O-succinylhomoserine sulfhydrylase [Bauldia sp.]